MLHAPKHVSIAFIVPRKTSLTLRMFTPAAERGGGMGEAALGNGAPKPYKVRTVDPASMTPPQEANVQLHEDEDEDEDEAPAPQRPAGAKVALSPACAYLCVSLHRSCLAFRLRVRFPCGDSYAAADVWEKLKSQSAAYHCRLPPPRDV